MRAEMPPPTDLVVWYGSIGMMREWRVDEVVFEEALERMDGEMEARF